MTRDSFLFTSKSSSLTQTNFKIDYKQSKYDYVKGVAWQAFPWAVIKVWYWVTSTSPCCTHSSQTQWSCCCRNWRQHSFQWLPLHWHYGWDCPALLSLRLLVHLQIQKVRDVLRGSGKYGVSECITEFNCLTNYNQYCITLYWMNILANLFRLLKCGKMQNL